MAPTEARDADAQKQRAQEPHAQERKVWNGDAGLRWVHDRMRVDAILDPVATAIIERADPVEAEKVVDIGCGGTGLELRLLVRTKPFTKRTSLTLAETKPASAGPRAAGLPRR